MNPDLKKLIDGKRRWAEPLSKEEQKKGFKGWYASKKLPHFDSPGTTQFITWRLHDSMPAERRSEWEAFLHLENEEEKRKQIELYIDRGLGECHLRRSDIAEIIQESLWHSDDVNYRLRAWVVMPNHVHVLVEIWELPMGELLKAWKGYTAKEANKLLRLKGTFWSEDYFDRYIRDEEHFSRVRRYIENNPVKAGLVKAPDDWLWSSARFRSKTDFNQLLHRSGDVLVPGTKNAEKNEKNRGRGRPLSDR